MDDYVRKYGNFIAGVMNEHTAAARRLIDIGLTEELIKMKVAPRKELPRAMRNLNYMSMDKVRKGLRNPARSCWTNIFAPVEILQCFDLNCLSIECLSSFFSGFKMEDHLINAAEASGIVPTLCSYHKNFIGAVDMGLVSKPPMSVTTSMVCDGNISTFRHLEKKHGVPCFVLDIPYDYTKQAQDYLVGQLKELIELLELKTGSRFDIDRLREVLERENLSKHYYKQFMKESITRQYPRTMTLEMFFLFVTHLDIGTEQSLRFFREVSRDIRNYPKREGKAIFWVHLMPYYQQSVQSFLNCQREHFIQMSDMNLDYLPELDTKEPLEALARKMILNIYNGPYERKAKYVAKMAEKFESDAVINFCHWGCRQSAGGIMLLKEELQKKDIPLLILDGDGVDRRNSHDGQIRTRLEAFLEMIE